MKRTYFFCLLASMVYFVVAAQEVSGLTQQLLKDKNILLMLRAPGIGGIKTHVFYLYEVLEKLGARPHLLLHDNAAPALEHARKQGWRFSTCTPAAKYDPETASQIAAICQQQKIELIHTNFREDMWYIRALKKQHVSMRVIRTVHADVEPLTMPWGGPDVYSDAIITVNKNIADRMRRADIVHAHKFFVCNPLFNEQAFLNFVPTIGRADFFKERFNIELGSRAVYTLVANFFPSKAPERAIYAFKKLIYEQHQQLCLMLAGTGQTFDACAQLIKELKLEKHVYQLGHVRDVKTLMAHSDCILNTSKYESYGLSLLEAAALRKPIIATYGTGTNTFIEHGKTGLLFHGDNVDELCSCITTYLNNIPLRIQLTNNCHQRLCERFTLQHAVDQLLEAYAAVLRL